MALHRRDFLVLSGAGGVGLLLGCRLGCNKTPEKLGAPPEISDDSQKWFNAWVAIGADDRVYLRIHEAEMGQGILTGLAMALAEELDVEWSSVQAEHAPADSARYGRQSTGGSTSTRDNHAMLRKMGAAARHMLVQAAAQAWGVPAVECTTTPGQVRHAASARQTRYGALVNEAAKLPVPEAPKLKAAADFQLLGSSPPRLDIPTKVTGETQYGIDVRRPNMLFGVVARAPHFGATVKSFDDAPARQVLGVQDVLQIPSGVLVLADHTWAALRGREALKVQWNASEHAELNDQSIREQLVRAIPKGRAARDDGDVKAVLHKAQQRIEAVYEVPYLAHACLEPVNCTAEVTTDGCEVWVGTQSPTATQQTAAEICGIPTERVKVHSMMLGGGFGRRSHTDFVSDAVFAAKAARRPVQVLWTREDDTRGGHYRPVGYNTLSGALDAEGWPLAWEHRIASPGILAQNGKQRGGIDPTSVEGAQNIPYAIPHVRVTYAHVELPLTVWWWRSVGSSQNAFITECFLDELAAAGKKDPLEVRRRLLVDRPRHKKVLEVAAEKAGWGTPLAAGRAHGVAVHECFGSFVAQVAEVSLQDGRPVVHRVTCAVDCGQAIHPDNVAAQMESGIVYGLSTLHNGLSIKDGAVQQGNFDTYPVLRLPQMPVIDTHIVSSGEALGGIGEPGTPPIAAAVCNALRTLTGKAFRKLPLPEIA